MATVANIVTEIIYALHSNGTDAAAFAAESGWMEVADRQGIIVILPNALDKKWNSTLDPAKTNDGEFLKAVVAAPSQNYYKHPTNRYLTGYREGSTLAHELQIRNPHLFAAFAGVSGSAAVPAEYIKTPATRNSPMDARLKNQDVP